MSAAMPASRFEATPVASGLAVSPADTVTWPSGVIRTASSASTRLRLSARSRPIRSAVPDSFTSAFGAVATTAWSRSRTTMSRIRTAIRIRPARSICVPPTSTVLPWPILSSIAAASHGVATSRLIGPAPSRHHSPPKQLDEDHRQHGDHDGQALDPAFAGQPAAAALRTCRRTDEIRNWDGTAAGARGSAPPRRAPGPSRPHHPIAGFEPRHADSTPWAKYS